MVDSKKTLKDHAWFKIPIKTLLLYPHEKMRKPCSTMYSPKRSFATNKKTFAEPELIVSTV